MKDKLITDEEVKFIPLGPRPILLIRSKAKLSQAAIVGMTKSLEHITEYLPLVIDEDMTIEIVSDETLHFKPSVASGILLGKDIKTAYDRVGDKNL